MDATVVKASLGVTINIGNFSNVRIDVGIEDYAREGENVDQAFERVYAFVEKKLEQKITEVNSDMMKYRGE